jgi:subtilisin family serine protease
MTQIEYTRRRGGLTKCASVIALTLALGISQPIPAHASDGPSLSVVGEGGMSVSVNVDGLMQRVADVGTLRVVVQLDMDYAAYGTITDSEFEAQEREIAAAQTRLLSRLDNPQEVRRYRTLPSLALNVDEADLQQLLGAPGIAAIGESAPAAPFLPDSTSRDLTNARPLWAAGHTGEGQSIAVLDTGLWQGHFAFFGPNFRNKVRASACYSLNNPAQSVTSLCPNGETELVAPFSGRAAPECDASIFGCNHGTHVAATAAGHLGRQFGSSGPLHGMALDADIIPIQVFARQDGFVQCDGRSSCLTGTLDSVASGLEKAFLWRNRDNITVVNLSLGVRERIFSDQCDEEIAGNPGFAEVAQAINNLRGAGIAVVAASGNDGSNAGIGFPACLTSAIAVGNTTKDDEVNDDVLPDGRRVGSNHSSIVDLMAPGTLIEAADGSRTQPRARRATRYMTGTSMAAPHVAGAFATLRSFAPDARLVELERALACTGLPVSRENVPKPRIRMAHARNYLNNPPATRGWGFGRDAQVMAWEEIMARRDRQGDTLRLRPDGSTSWAFALAPYCVNDVSVIAQMRRAEPSGSWPTGLLLTAVAHDNAVSGLLFTYAAIDATRAVVRVESVEGPEAVNNTRTRDLCAELIEASVRDSPQILSATKQGNELRFRFNGQEVCSNRTIEVDSRFRFGRVGVVMRAPSGQASDGHQMNLIRMVARPLNPSDPIANSSYQDIPLQPMSFGEGEVSVIDVATEPEVVSGN